jgi:hypothetical protein
MIGGKGNIMNKRKLSDSDNFLKSILSSKNAIECLAWLTESDKQRRTLGEDVDPEISIVFVKSLYDSGARKVWVFDIDDYRDDGQNSGKLIIELPDDPSQRHRLFIICGEIANRLGYDAEKDTNQEAILLMLD